MFLNGFCRLFSNTLELLFHFRLLMHGFVNVLCIWARSVSYSEVRPGQAAARAGFENAKKVSESPAPCNIISDPERLMMKETKFVPVFQGDLPGEEHDLPPVSGGCVPGCESSAVVRAAFQMLGTCTFYKHAGRSDFQDWCRSESTQVTEGPMSLSCWEFILVAALRAGVLDPTAVKAFFRKLPEDAERASFAIKRALGYYNADVCTGRVIRPDPFSSRKGVSAAVTGDFIPLPGDIVFVDFDYHVALALGQLNSAGEHEALHLPAFRPVEKTTFEQLISLQCPFQDSPRIELRVVKNPWPYLKECTEAALL